MNRTRKQGWGFLALCVVPGFVAYAVVFVYPTLSTFALSFFQYSGVGGEMTFVGWDNFTYMFHDRHLIHSLVNTLVLMVIVPLPTLLLSLLTAAALARKDLKERNFYRTVFFFPSVLSFVVVAVVWNFILTPNSGLLNNLLRAVGLESAALPWLGDSRTALGAVAVVLVWQAFGYYMVMYIAGIDSIPQELYEAAEVDGATPFQQFRKITIPLLWSILRITIIFMINGSVAISFVVANVLTNGGPAWSTEVVLLQMYRQGTTNANYGYSMAIAVVVFLFCLVLSFISNRLTAREESL